MFRILACHGTSHESRAIEFLTGPRSHIRIEALADYSDPHIVDALGRPVDLKAGECVEAWNTGVRKIARWDVDYAPGTVIEAFSLREPLTEEPFGQFKVGARFLCRQIGKPYNLPGCVRLALPPGARPTPDYAALSVLEYPQYFCSELGAGLFVTMGIPAFNTEQPYDITPQELVESTRLNAAPDILVVE